MRIVDIITDVYIIDVSFVPSSASNAHTHTYTHRYTHPHTHKHTYTHAAHTDTIASHEYIRSKFIVVDVFQKSNPIPGGGQE